MSEEAKKKQITIAVQGCAHGNLDSIYSQVMAHNSNNPNQIELLLCCGDFQSMRNLDDLETLSCPVKYRQMGDFYQYYAGTKVAPVLTIFIGGNHEASGYLQELYYGGWVAPNIYYLGKAGVVNYKGLRIGGISGIYKYHDYNMGHWERPPYDNSSLRSVYHVRNLEAYRLSLMKQKINIILSHDWPRGIAYHGNQRYLFRKKKFLEKEVRENTLGSPPCEMLLHKLKPDRWFSAHLHVRFHAKVVHHKIIQQHEKKVNDDALTSEATEFVGLESDSCDLRSLQDQFTQFLSLDKCLPGRQHLEILDINVSTRDEISDEEASATTPGLEYDLEWLTILRKTDYLLSNARRRIQMPNIDIEISESDLEETRAGFSSSLPSETIVGKGRFIIPLNFEATVPPSIPGQNSIRRGRAMSMIGNPQTDLLLSKLRLPHKVTTQFIKFLNDSGSSASCSGSIKLVPSSVVIAKRPRIELQSQQDECEIDLDDDEDLDDKKVVPIKECEVSLEDKNEIDLDNDL